MLGLEPSVTVVVPARNRKADVLATLENVLRSDYSALSVILFDNHSEDGTSEAVRQMFGDAVTVVRSGTPLAMVDSFETAYGLVDTEWVLGLGADDGLTDTAISRLIEGAVAAELRAATALRAAYIYPHVFSKDSTGEVRVPHTRPDEIVQSRDIVRSVLRGRTKWSLLPSGYFGLVRADVLAELRQQHGRIFTSLTPDVGLNFSVARLVDRYLIVGEPLLIAGASPSSNGASQFGVTDSAAIESFWGENERSSVTLHPSFSPVDSRLPASIRALCLEAFLQSGRPTSVLDRVITSPLVQYCMESFERAEPAHWWHLFADHHARGSLSRVFVRFVRRSSRGWHSMATFRGYARAGYLRSRRAIGAPLASPQPKHALREQGFPSLRAAALRVQDFMVETRSSTQSGTER